MTLFFSFSFPDIITTEKKSMAFGVVITKEFKVAIITFTPEDDVKPKPPFYLLPYIEGALLKEGGEINRALSLIPTLHETMHTLEMGGVKPVFSQDRHIITGLVESKASGLPCPIYLQAPLGQAKDNLPKRLNLAFDQNHSIAEDLEDFEALGKLVREEGPILIQLDFDGWNRIHEFLRHLWRLLYGNRIPGVKSAQPSIIFDCTADD